MPGPTTPAAPRSCDTGDLDDADRRPERSDPAAPRAMPRPITIARWPGRSRAAPSATAGFTDAIRIEPQSAASYVGRGHIRLDRDEFNRAISDFDLAVLMDPQFAEAYASRGTALAQAGRARPRDCRVQQGAAHPAGRRRPPPSRQCLVREGRHRARDRGLSARRSGSIRPTPTPSPTAATCTRCAAGSMRRSPTGAKRCGCDRPPPTIAAAAPPGSSAAIRLGRSPTSPR